MNWIQYFYDAFIWRICHRIQKRLQLRRQESYGKSLFTSMIILRPFNNPDSSKFWNFESICGSNFPPHCWYQFRNQNPFFFLPLKTAARMLIFQFFLLSAFSKNTKPFLVLLCPILYIFLNFDSFGATARSCARTPQLNLKKVDFMC